MAKKRSKKDRQRAASRRANQVPALRPTIAAVSKTQSSAVASTQFLSQNLALIRQDLRKTALVTLLILLVLFSVAFIYT